MEEREERDSTRRKQQDAERQRAREWHVERRQQRGCTIYEVSPGGGNALISNVSNVSPLPYSLP